MKKITVFIGVLTAIFCIAFSDVTLASYVGPKTPFNPFDPPKPKSTPKPQQAAPVQASPMKGTPHCSIVEFENDDGSPSGECAEVCDYDNGFTMGERYACRGAV